MPIPGRIQKNLTSITVSDKGRFDRLVQIMLKLKKFKVQNQMRTF